MADEIIKQIRFTGPYGITPVVLVRIGLSDFNIEFESLNDGGRFPAWDDWCNFFLNDEDVLELLNFAMRLPQLRPKFIKEIDDDKWERIELWEANVNHEWAEKYKDTHRLLYTIDCRPGNRVEPGDDYMNDIRHTDLLDLLGYFSEHEMFGVPNRDVLKKIIVSKTPMGNSVFEYENPAVVTKDDEIDGLFIPLTALTGYLREDED